LWTEQIANCYEGFGETWPTLVKEKWAWFQHVYNLLREFYAGVHTVSIGALQLGRGFHTLNLLATAAKYPQSR